MDDQYGMGGSFISNWDFFLNISKPRSDTWYKKPSIFWRHSDSRFEKENIYSTKQHSQHVFSYFHPCVVSVNDRRRFRSWSNRKGTLCDFLATAISSSMRVRGRQDENYSVGKGQLTRKSNDFEVTAFCWEDLVGFDNNLIHFAFLGTNSICYN